tara:strand:- start:325 stop:534 length:210 start_codon:yes stop_codon:yes gene_type:complete
VTLESVPREAVNRRGFEGSTGKTEDDQALLVGFVDFIPIDMFAGLRWLAQVEDSAIESAASVVEYGENP